MGECGKKIAHKLGLWHKSILFVMLDYERNLIFFQTKNKNHYDFERQNYLDFVVGGHVLSGESEIDAVIRESKEEIGLNVKQEDIFLAGVRQTSHKVAENFIEREFQFIFSHTTQLDLRKLKVDKKEVTSIVYCNIDELLKLLEGDTDKIYMKEYENPNTNPFPIGLNDFPPSFIAKDMLIPKIAKMSFNLVKRYNNTDMQIYI